MPAPDARAGATPEWRARKLIEKDPMHAALVRRSFNPKGYKALGAVARALARVRRRPDPHPT